MAAAAEHESAGTPLAPPHPDHVQREQPPGVSPLALTGERTLPDVPAENYWYRRHLVVYEWIAERCGGLEVVDLACGEGYGTEVLGRRAARVVGVDANPEAHEHARARYTRPGVRFERDLIETFAERCDAVVFLQTIEHVEDDAGVLEHVRSLLRPGGVGYVSTPNVLTLAPPGTVKSDNPWHVREYRPEQFRTLCEGSFARVETYGLFHAGKLRLHELALRAGWDRLHPAVRLTGSFYGWFTAAISSGDFTLRKAPPGPAGDRALAGALDFLAVLR